MLPPAVDRYPMSTLDRESPNFILRILGPMCRNKHIRHSATPGEEGGVIKNTKWCKVLNVATQRTLILLYLSAIKGYDALVVVRPLLFQVLDEAGNFPMELHHHPARTDKGMFSRWRTRQRLIAHFSQLESLQQGKMITAYFRRSGS